MVRVPAVDDVDWDVKRVWQDVFNAGEAERKDNQTNLNPF